MPESFNKTEPALLVENLSKIYSNGVDALKQVNLRVQHGDFFALLGPNGAGKSTLIGIISSLVTASSGDVRIFGISMRQQRDQAVKLVGLVPQEINFSIFEKPFDICVNQAGFYGIKRKIAIARAEKYLNALSLWDKAFRPSRELSGGMKRRLMIARALMSDPKLLILDEPTAGVDIEIRRSMWEFVRTINASGTTVILTTHYLEEAEQLCRNVAIIDHGRIVRNTSMEALLATLDQETLLLDTATTIRADISSVPGIELRRLDANKLEAHITRGSNLNTLFAALSAQDILITSMQRQTNRLEELFVHLVGDTKPGAAETSK